MPNDAASCLIRGKYSEETVISSMREATGKLAAPASLALAFISGQWIDAREEILELIRVYGRAPTVIGCSGGGLIGTAHEAEGESGLSILFLCLPNTKIVVSEFTTEQVEESSGPGYWQMETGCAADAVDAWIVLANPFTFPIDPWLRDWNQAYPGVPCLGGMGSSASANPEDVMLFHDGKTIKADAIVAGLHGGIKVRTVVSQGCDPIGEALPITNAQKNVILSLGSRPAYEVLSEAFQTLPEKVRARAQGNLFAGLAFSEYQDEFKRGDFLIRNILGADPNTGAVAIGATPRVGQTLQYQLRDREAAEQDLRALIQQARINGVEPFASLLFCCNGRGRGLFGSPHHDAKALADGFGTQPSAGFFCNGEIGPVGAINFVHGYTASIALFCEDED